MGFFVGEKISLLQCNGEIMRVKVRCKNEFMVLEMLSWGGAPLSREVGGCCYSC